MDDPIMTNGFVTLGCGLVVALYAAKRYDTPETNRLSTTQSLFLLSGAGYVTASLALFLMLSEIVLKPGVLTFLGLDDAQKLVATYSAPPVLAAVILTTLLPNTAVLNTADTWLLKRFQAWGRIPQGVRTLADRMTQDALLLADTDLRDLNGWITSDADVPNELAARVSVDPAQTPRGNLTRVLRLYQELEKLEAIPGYAKAFRIRNQIWQAIHQDFRVFTAQSQAFFVLFDRLGPVEGAAGVDALNRARDCYHEICGKQHEQLAEFLAQLLLIAEGSEPRIESRLQSIGFCVPTTVRSPLPIGPFVFMGVVMIVAILAVVAALPPRPAGPLPLAINALLIGTTKTIGVLAAVLPKLCWRRFRPDDRGNPPYLSWLASAILAAGGALLIERAALMIAHHTASAGLDFAHYPLSPLAPTTFAICLSIAVICDVDLRLGDGWLRRVSEALLCGATMVASIFICINLLNIPSTTENETSAWFPFALSFCLGFASGFVAPYLYRRERGEERQTRASVALAA